MLKSTLKKHLSTLCLTVGLLVLGQSPLLAQDNPTPMPESEIPRFGVGLNGGVNNVGMPFLGATLSYRSPFLEDRLRFVAQYDFLNYVAHTPNTSSLWLGFHHDLYTQPDWANLRAYWRLMLGAISMYLPPMIPGENQPTQWNSVWVPGVQIGFGAEVQLAGSLWGFAQVSTGFPLVIRPEIGFNFVF